jgi:transcription elongation factor Elf1
MTDWIAVTCARCGSKNVTVASHEAYRFDLQQWGHDALCGHCGRRSRTSQS